MFRTDSNNIISFKDPSFKNIGKLFLIFVIPIYAVVFFIFSLSLFNGAVGMIVFQSLWTVIATVGGVIILFYFFSLLHELCHFITAKLFHVSSRIGFYRNISTPADVTFNRGQEFTKRSFIIIAIVPFIVTIALIIGVILIPFLYEVKLLLMALLLIKVMYCNGDLSFVVQAQAKVRCSEQRIIYEGKDTDGNHRYVVK
jgi:Putative zincin peptidase